LIHLKESFKSFKGDSKRRKFKEETTSKSLFLLDTSVWLTYMEDKERVDKKILILL